MIGIGNKVVRITPTIQLISVLMICIIKLHQMHTFLVEKSRYTGAPEALKQAIRANLYVIRWKYANLFDFVQSNPYSSWSRIIVLQFS